MKLIKKHLRLSEICDSRFPTCLPIVSIDMGTTVGGNSGGIQPDPSLETGRGEEKDLKKWRLEFREIQEQEEEKIA